MVEGGNAIVVSKDSNPTYALYTVADAAKNFGH